MAKTTVVPNANVLNYALDSLGAERERHHALAYAIWDRLRNPEPGTEPDSITVKLAEMLEDQLSDTREVQALRTLAGTTNG